ncbi:hypothetical protein C8R44DRAFT_754928 [Mycena epipterygia]|nr:hypothetical protein C8R44DRAFT_754928 [Mycena epipterygia]
MPPTTMVTKTRLDNIVACLTPTLSLLVKFSDAFGTPFLPAISNTTGSLITLVQNVKKNKEECIKLMENVHELLYAVVNLHTNTGTPSSLPPATLSAFGELTETLHKVYAFMEAQQDGNKIKHFFRQSEMKTLLNDCHIGLQKVFDMFKMEGAINLHGNIIEMQKETERIHKELLEAISASSNATISTSSNGTISDRSSSLNNTYVFPSSSNSISMLPAQPKIFHGRESELKHIVEILCEEPARMAILGAGGMGKTSLVKAALHHPDIVAKYQNRFFVAADSATTSIELAALIGLHIGLKPGTDLTKPVVHYFSNKGPTLLILDNLETLWEPVETRGGVEEFLSCLTDVCHLALMASAYQLWITMRGAERPAKVHWTSPFLQPLDPLSAEAAHQTFVAIAEDFHDNEDITKLLSLTDNMPLAVDLIAHLVDHEGCKDVLARWETEKTSLLSSGYDRRSNLDMSITISLLSPRLNSGAIDLLSLLSILPDGLSDAELLQSTLSIKNVLECRSMLLRTSLAYKDDRKRLKSLVPVREHMQQFHPPPPSLIQQVEKYFHLLLDVYETHHGSQQVAEQHNQITSNLGNLHQVLLQGLQSDNPTLADTISCAISLSSFSRQAGYGRHVLMNHIPAALSSIHDDRLEALFIVEVFHSRLYHLIVNPEQLIAQAISHFGKFHDLLLESRFYYGIGQYSFFNQGDISKAIQFLDKALVLSKSCGNKKQQAAVLNELALISCNIGNYPAAQIQARRAQGLAQLSADLYHESYALCIEAMCAGGLGNYKNSMFLCHRGRKLLELCGMSQGRLNYDIVAVEADLHLQKSEYAEARNIHTEILRNTQNTYDHAFGLLNLAQIDILISASAHDVHQNLEKARELFTASGFPLGLNYCEISSAELHLREKEMDNAKLIFQMYFSSLWQSNDQAAISCLESLANTSQWPACDFTWASRWTVVFLAYAKGKQNKQALHKALQFLGDMFLKQGDLDTAGSLFTVALETFTYMDIHRSRGQCMLHLGDIAEQRGDLVEAVKFWKDARPLFECSLQAKAITQIDTKLASMEQQISDTYQTSLALLTQLETPTISEDELTVTASLPHPILKQRMESLGVR